MIARLSIQAKPIALVLQIFQYCFSSQDHGNVNIAPLSLVYSVLLSFSIHLSETVMKFSHFTSSLLRFEWLPKHWIINMTVQKTIFTRECNSVGFKRIPYSIYFSSSLPRLKWSSIWPSMYLVNDLCRQFRLICTCQHQIELRIQIKISTFKPSR